VFSLVTRVAEGKRYVTRLNTAARPDS